MFKSISALRVSSAPSASAASVASASTTAASALLSSISSAAHLFTHSYAEQQHFLQSPLKDEEQCLTNFAVEFERNLLQSATVQPRATPFQEFLYSMPPPRHVFRLAAFGELLSSSSSSQQRDFFVSLPVALRAAEEVQLFFSDERRRQQPHERQRAPCCTCQDERLAISLLRHAVHVLDTVSNEQKKKMQSLQMRLLLSAACHLLGRSSNDHSGNLYSGGHARAEIQELLMSRDDDGQNNNRRRRKKKSEVRNRLTTVISRLAPEPAAPTAADDSVPRSDNDEAATQTKDASASVAARVSRCVDSFFFPAKSSASLSNIQNDADNSAVLTRADLQATTATCTHANFSELADVFAAFAVLSSQQAAVTAAAAATKRNNDMNSNGAAAAAEGGGENARRSQETTALSSTSGVLPFEFLSELSSVAYVVTRRLQQLHEKHEQQQQQQEQQHQLDDVDQTLNIHNNGHVEERSMTEQEQTIDCSSAAIKSDMRSLEKIALAASFLKQLHSNAELWQGVLQCFNSLMMRFKHQQEQQKQRREAASSSEAEEQDVAAATLKSARGVLFALRARSVALEDHIEAMRMAGKNKTKQSHTVLLSARRSFDAAEKILLDSF